MTESQVLKLLEQRIKHDGSALAFARKKGISVQYLSDVRKRRRGLSTRMLAALGLVAFIDYRVIKDVTP